MLMIKCIIHIFIFWIQVSYFCSETLKIYREHSGKHDDLSPERSRSFSRSPSLCSERDYRRSPNPRENGCGHRCKNDYPPSRSPIVKGNGHTSSRSRSQPYSSR